MFLVGGLEIGAAPAEIEIDDVIDMLLESYKDAKDANQHGPAVRAVELLGKHLAMFKGRITLSFARR